MSCSAGVQEPLSRAVLQVDHSRLMLKCPQILWEEPGVSSPEPGHRFPVWLTASFLIPAPFCPPLSSQQDMSPLRAEALGAAGAAAATPGGCRIPRPCRGARCWLWRSSSRPQQGEDINKGRSHLRFPGEQGAQLGPGGCERHSRLAQCQRLIVKEH